MSKKKNILLIFASSYNEKNHLIKRRKIYMPSRTMPYIASLTPSHFNVRIINEYIDDIDFSQDVDLVALTGMISNIPRSIEIARAFRKRKVKTIIGGVGAYALQDYILENNAFDSIVIGEVDDLWEEIVDDFDRNRLKPVYQCVDAPSLDGMPFARYDLLDMNKYFKSFNDRRSSIIPIETGRGCTHNCSYCFVTKYFGKKMRYRPIGEVVEEIKHHRAKRLLFNDDNLAFNQTRALELFRAVQKLDIGWTGQFESSIIDHPELLQAAADSGCTGAFLGIESLDPQILKSVNKRSNMRYSIEDIGKAFKRVGIPVVASVILGLDGDTKENIYSTLRRLIDNDIDTLIP